MYLCIDNSKTEKNVFFVSRDGKSWRTYEYEVDAEGSLPRHLQKILSEEEVELTDLRGLAVRVGVGKFTATRLAVTFANTLAYSLKIPVVAVKEIETVSIASLIDSTPIGQYAPATYSAEPRIGNK